MAMLKEDKSNIPISETEKDLVYQTLFNAPDSGLLKGGDNSDVTGLLMSIITKLKY